MEGRGGGRYRWRAEGVGGIRWSAQTDRREEESKAKQSEAKPKERMRKSTPGDSCVDRSSAGFCEGIKKSKKKNKIKKRQKKPKKEKRGTKRCDDNLFFILIR